MPHKTRCGPLDHRHPAVREALRDLESDHLPEHLAVIAREIENAAHSIVCRTKDGPRLTMGLNLLVQAKDALVRQAVRDVEDEPVTNEKPRTPAQQTQDALIAAREYPSRPFRPGEPRSEGAAMRCAPDPDPEIPIAGMTRSMTEDEIRMAIGED